MVEIRTIKPSFQIALPSKSNTPDYTARWNARRGQVVRRRDEFPPPTPQPTPCVLWQGACDRDGYGRLWVYPKNAKRYQTGPHRWIVEQVLGRRLTPSEFVLHACDNPPCFRLDHLSVGTVQDNNIDMRSKGRDSKPPKVVRYGSANGNSRYTARDVERVRKLWQAGLKQRSIAEETGISLSHVQRLVTGVAWQKPPPTIWEKIEAEKKQAAVEAAAAAASQRNNDVKEDDDHVG